MTGGAEPLGIVVGLFVAPAAGVDLLPVDQALVTESRGIEGDRYAAGIGSFSRWAGWGRAVSLIEEEAIEAVKREYGIDLSQGRSRRNVVTRGVTLKALNGRVFRIGSVLFRGARECLPCRYLEKKTTPGVYDALKGRGGLRADVLRSGFFRVGDAVELADVDRTPPARK